MNTNDPGYLIGVLVGAAMVGALCGTLPLAVARSRERMGLGWLGFGLCLVAGFLLGLYGAVPTAVVMTLVILIVGRPARKTRRSGPDLKPRTPAPLPYEL